MRNGGLERVEAVVQRQERVLPKGNDDGLFLKREHRRLGLLGSGGPVGNRATLLPLGDSFWIDAVAPGPAWCMDHGYGRTAPYPVRGQATRTYFGRPSA